MENLAAGYSLSRKLRGPRERALEVGLLPGVRQDPLCAVQGPKGSYLPEQAVP